MIPVPVGLLRFKWTFLVVGVILIAVGIGSYAAARPAAPVEIDGTVANYTEYTQNGVYDRNELQLANDSNTYTLDKTTFHPALPDSLFRDGKVSVWVDQGSTTVIAITLYDENNENPVKYTTDHYDNPSSERSDGQSFGIVMGVIGAILVAVFTLWFMLGRSRRPLAIPAIGPAPSLPLPVSPTAAMPGATAGLSADGRWYWEGGQWREVSADGRYWWDGARWQDVGAVPAASGATPPIA